MSFFTDCSKHKFKSLDLPGSSISPLFSKGSFTFCTLLAEISIFQCNLQFFQP
uniref:Pco088261 n=1 Tax=Arundo donax TaxID=35708 RepID=A0A0A9CE55_ARUDO